MAVFTEQLSVIEDNTPHWGQGRAHTPGLEPWSNTSLMNVDENGGLDKQKITDLKQYQYKIMKYISTKRPDDESKSPKSLIEEL